MNQLVQSPTLGRPPEDPDGLWYEVIRPLTPDDLTTLIGLAIGAEKPTIVQIKSAHHNIAQLLASGLEHEEVSQITGYSPQYVSKLKRDPSFASLLEFYLDTRKKSLVNAIERLTAAGITALDEIQQRLAESPEKWQNRELMEFVEKALVKPAIAAMTAQAAASGTGASPNGVTLNVSFVSTDKQTQQTNDLPGDIIDGDIIDD